MLRLLGPSFENWSCQPFGSTCLFFAAGEFGHKLQCTGVRFRPAAADFPKREGCYHTRNRLSTTDVGEAGKLRFRKVLDFNPMFSDGLWLMPNGMDADGP